MGAVWAVSKLGEMAHKLMNALVKLLNRAAGSRTPEIAAANSGTTVANFIGMAAAFTAGQAGMVFSPFTVGSMAQIYRINDGTAGLFMSLELAVMALSAIFISVRLNRVSIRGLVLFAWVSMIIGYGQPAVFQSLPALGAARILAGMGTGCLLAVANGTAARCDRSATAFSLMAMTYCAVAMVMLILMPRVIDAWGHEAYFVVLAGLTAVMAPFALLIGRRVQPVRGSMAQDSNGLSGRRFNAIWIFGLLAFALLFLGLNGLWAYTERIASAGGLTYEQMSVAYPIGSFFSVLAALFGGWAILRLGVTRALAIGMVIAIASPFAYLPAGSVAAFALATTMMGFGIVASSVVLRYVLSEIDPSGRLAAGSGAVEALVSATGPGLFGLILLAGGNFVILIFTASAIVLVSYLFSFRPVGFAARAS